MQDLFDLKSNYQIKTNKQTKKEGTILQQLLLNSLFRNGTPFLKLLYMMLASLLVTILNHFIKQNKK